MALPAQTTPPLPNVQPKAQQKRSFGERLIAGGIILVGSLAINVALYVIFSRVFKVNYLFSNAWAWLGYVLFLYFTRKYYFYRYTALGFAAKWREFFRFMGVRLGTGILDMLLMFIMVGLVRAHPLNAKIIAIVVVSIINIIFTNFWIFKPQRPKTAKKSA